MASKLHNALAKKLPDIQMSEAFINCVFLAMSGGLQDAYTYLTRDGGFANAQTGNVVLMSTNFMTGKWGEGLKYLFPIHDILALCNYRIGTFLANLSMVSFCNTSETFLLFSNVSLQSANTAFIALGNSNFSSLS